MKTKNLFTLSRIVGRTTQHNTTRRINFLNFAFHIIILPLMALIPNKVFSQGWTINAYLDCNPVSVHLHCNSTGDDENILLTGKYNCCGWYLDSLTGTSNKVSCTCADATITIGGTPIPLTNIIYPPVPPTDPSYPFIICCPTVSATCTTNGCGVVTVDTQLVQSEFLNLLFVHENTTNYFYYLFI